MGVWKDLLKGPLIISTPDIRHRTLGQLDGRQYLVLACDGLYDVCSNEECRDWLVQQLRHTSDVQALAEVLCDEAVNVRRSSDNVSVVLIQLDQVEQAEKQTVRTKGQAEEQQKRKLIKPIDPE